MIVNMLNDANNFSRSLSPLIDDCRVLLSKIPVHKVQPCFREANRCINALAKMGADMDMDFITFQLPPDCIGNEIRIDASSTAYCRSLVFLSNLF